MSLFDLISNKPNMGSEFMTDRPTDIGTKKDKAEKEPQEIPKFKKEKVRLAFV